MSHELRTPLNAIIGFSEVMTHEMFGPVGSPRYLEYSRLIHESGNHLLELINSVLDMSKIEAGKLDLFEEVFDLTDVAESAVRFVRLHAERAGVALKLVVEPGAGTIFADKRAIKQVLINLLTNGVKFTPRGGDVRVRAAKGAAGIEITVADSGVGISEKDLARLGKPFEQVEAEHVRSREGTGLGLALVKALALMHGGEAVIESVLGEGTTVRVRLPFAAVGANGEAVRPREAKIIPFRARRDFSSGLCYIGPMTEETENLVLEMLRKMRGTLDRIEHDVSDLKNRMSSVEHLLGQHQMQFAAVNIRLDRLDERFGRIERRLELVDA